MAQQQPMNLAWPNGLPMPTTIPELVEYVAAEAQQTYTLSHSNGVHDSLEPAARSLWSLAYNNPSNQQLLAECGGISALAQLLTFRHRQDILQSACGCLWNLAANPHLHAAVGSSEAVPLLVQLMQDECGPAVTMEQAAGTLSTLANNHADNCKKIVLSGGRTAVVRILCSPNSTDNARQFSASILCSLALSDPTNQQLITAAGGIMALLPLLRAERSSPALLQQAALTIKVLALDPDNKTIIAALGAIPVLIRLIGSSQEQAVLWSAAGALRNLICEHAINQAALAASPGGLATLVRVLQNKANAQSLLQQIAAVLTCLSCSSHTHQALLSEPGCVTALLQLLDPKASSPAVMERAAVSLALLSSNPNAQQLLRRVGAIRTLVGLLGSTACDHLVVKQVGDTLLNLAYNNPGRQAAIRGAGGIAAIKQLLSHAKRAARGSTCMPGTAVDVLEQLLRILQSNLSKQSGQLFDETPPAEFVTEHQAEAVEGSHDAASLATMSLASMRRESAAEASVVAAAAEVPDNTAIVDTCEPADTVGTNADQAQFETTFSRCDTAETTVGSRSDSVISLDTQPQVASNDIIPDKGDAVSNVALSGGHAVNINKNTAAQQITRLPDSRTAKRRPGEAGMQSGAANRAFKSSQSVEANTPLTSSSIRSSWIDVVKMGPQQARSGTTVTVTSSAESATQAADKVVAASSKQTVEKTTTTSPSWSSVVSKGRSRTRVA